MGTPNSNNKYNPRTMLHQVLIEGKPLDWEQLIASGIDVATLRAKHENIKPQLPYLEGYVAIEDALKWRSDADIWKSSVLGLTNLATQQCLHFLHPSKDVPCSVLRAIPLSGARPLDTDVFLLRSGKFVAWTGQNGDQPPRLSIHDDAESLCQRLRAFVGTTHRYETRSMTPFPMVLGEGIDGFLYRSLKEKESRLRIQESYRARNEILNTRISMRK